jgi:hypothetical protein
MAQVVQHLPCKCEALNLTPVPPLLKKEHVSTPKRDPPALTLVQVQMPVTLLSLKHPILEQVLDFSFSSGR